MDLKDFLKQFEVNRIEYANKEFERLKKDFREMAQLKSDFDIEKLTTLRNGNFIAHDFHFLMRQYSLTLSELRRFILEKEEKIRLIEEFNEHIKKGMRKKSIYEGGEKKKVYCDLYIQKLLNEIDLIELQIIDKASRVFRYEQMREALIKRNGGVSITNEQYQKEEPLYLKWLLKRKAKEDMLFRNTGIHQGVWENISYLEQECLVNPEFQISVNLFDRDGELLEFEGIAEVEKIDKAS